MESNWVKNHAKVMKLIQASWIPSKILHRSRRSLVALKLRKIQSYQINPSVKIRQIKKIILQIPAPRMGFRIFGSTWIQVVFLPMMKTWKNPYSNRLLLRWDRQRKPRWKKFLGVKFTTTMFQWQVTTLTWRDGHQNRRKKIDWINSQFLQQIKKLP